MSFLTQKIVSGAIRGLSEVLGRLPATCSFTLGKFLGLCFYFISHRRHVAYADLKKAFGNKYSSRERWCIVRQHYMHLAQTAVEFIRFPSLDHQYVENMIHIQGRERFEALVQEGQGGILLTGHLGNWEVLQIISGILGKPMHVLARDQKHERINQLMNEIRQSHGSVAVSRGMGIRGLFRVLKDKGMIGLLGDQDAGKKGGVILPLLGRKTTVPTGAFEMARRLGVPILPCFTIRRGKEEHEVYVGERIECGSGDYEEKDLLPFIEDYLRVLEDQIKKRPEQWLWGSKRWKYSWTKRILVLSDGKPGHVKQSHAIVENMQQIHSQHDRLGMEYPQETIEVEFKSSLHRGLFKATAFFLMPWIQGNLQRLSFYFKSETVDLLKETAPDFIVSGGSSLTPLNLLLARENYAKSIVLMKPSFPYGFYKYDLAVVPAHDKGSVPKESFRNVLTPSQKDEVLMKHSFETMERDLKNPDKLKVGVFLGGDTRQFSIRVDDVKSLMGTLEEVAQEQNFDYAMTTSRRTSDDVIRYLNEGKSSFVGCQLLTIATEDFRPEVAHGMMAMADVLVVTEDSISMISEAISAGKEVIVLSFAKEDLPSKHQRFQDILVEKSAVTVASLHDLKHHLSHREELPQNGLFEQENLALQKRLQAML